METIVSGIAAVLTTAAFIPRAYKPMMLANAVTFALTVVIVTMKLYYG